jgi:amino acid transporter
MLTSSLALNMGAPNMAVVMPGRAASERPAIMQDVRTIGERMHVGIGAFSAWMLGVGSIIGSMAWLFPPYMIARAGAAASVTAWFLGALAFLPVTLILTELSSMFPAAGGPYLYKYYALKRLLGGSGELLGFLTGWLFWAALIVVYACMSNGLVNLLAECCYGCVAAAPLWFGPLVIIGLYGSTTLANLRHVSNIAFINNVFTVLKIAMALAFGWLVLCAPTTALANLWQPIGTAGSGSFMANVSSVLLIGLCGYGGIELLACTSSETKTAAQTVPRALLLTLVSVASIYALTCAAVGMAGHYVLSPDGATCQLPGTKTPANIPAVTGLLAGTMWGRLATAGVVASIVGCALSGMLACARIAYSLSVTGLFPKRFAQLHGSARVPAYALWFQLACICSVGVGAYLLSRLHVSADAYTFLAETFGFMYMVIIILYAASFMSLRYTDADMVRPFRIGGSGNTLAWALTLSVIAIFGYVGFVCTKPVYQLAGTIIILSGLPIYLYFKRKHWQED